MLTTDDCDDSSTALGAIATDEDCDEVGVCEGATSDSDCECHYDEGTWNYDVDY